MCETVHQGIKVSVAKQQSVNDASSFLSKRAIIANVKTERAGPVTIFQDFNRLTERL